MSVTQYIGARYVPLFADPVDWSSDRTYEPLTIVLHQGNSYTSMQFVPKGIDITNADFWVETGNYNAQVEQYRREVSAFDGRITANAQAIADEVTARMSADESIQGIIATLASKTELNDAVTPLATKTELNDAVAPLATKTELNDAVAPLATKEALNAETDTRANKDSELETKINTVKNNTYGCGFLAASKNEKVDTFTLMFSPDGIHFNEIANLNDVFDPVVDDLCHVEKIEDWYYIISQRTYKSKNLKDWVKVTNTPPMPTQYVNSSAWGYSHVKIGEQYYYIHCPSIDNVTTVANAVGGNSPVFHVFYGTCTFDNTTGEFTYNSQSILTQFGTTVESSYIDPSILYSNTYGLVLAIKNEVTSTIEIWTGSNFTSLAKVSNVGYMDVGFEAPKIIEIDNELFLYSHGYAAYYPTVTPVFNCVQRLTKNKAFISDGLKELVVTGDVKRHIGIMICDSVTFSHIANMTSNPNTITLSEYTAKWEKVNVINIPLPEGTYQIPNIPNCMVYARGINARTIEGLTRFNNFKPIKVITQTGENPNITFGTGILPTGKKMHYFGDSQLTYDLLPQFDKWFTIGD